jgi:Sulfotransferase domain
VPGLRGTQRCASAGTVSAPPLRIAMWSGPRNISTALMRAFEARGDTAVSDEPFYAAYLQRTGIEHPLRDAVIASQSCDWRVVAQLLTGPVPQGKPLGEFGRVWMQDVHNAFLIRDPEAVLASYARHRDAVTLEDIGFVQQRELFDAQADRLGRAPPVADAADILAAPDRILKKLCGALGIAFTPAMLHWPAGRRATDGVWAPAWYQAVEKSTGFAAPKPASALPARLRTLADQARPHYDALAQYRLI